MPRTTLSQQICEHLTRPSIDGSLSVGRPNYGIDDFRGDVFGEVTAGVVSLPDALSYSILPRFGLGNFIAVPFGRLSGDTSSATLANVLSSRHTVIAGVTIAAFLMPILDLHVPAVERVAPPPGQPLPVQRLQYSSRRRISTPAVTNLQRQPRATKG